MAKKILLQVLDVRYFIKKLLIFHERGLNYKQFEISFEPRGTLKQRAQRNLVEVANCNSCLQLKVFCKRLH
jgi:hypothetical protein